jgi:RimJ/RimL family protein N-acetyltransferase
MWFIVEDKERIVATCHVAYVKQDNIAELGLTVSPDYRNQKIGQELYFRGATWARMRGAETIFMHCLSENRAIQHIARKSGMTVVTYDMGEKEGNIKVSKNPSLARWEDTVWENMAVYDSVIRKQQWFFEKFMKRILGR